MGITWEFQVFFFYIVQSIHCWMRIPVCLLEFDYQPLACSVSLPKVIHEEISADINDIEYSICCINNVDVWKYIGLYVIFQREIGEHEPCS